MRETRQSGSEGGVRLNPSSLPLSVGRQSLGNQGSSGYVRLRQTLEFLKVLAYGHQPHWQTPTDTDGDANRCGRTPPSHQPSRWKTLQKGTVEFPGKSGHFYFDHETH